MEEGRKMEPAIMGNEDIYLYPRLQFIYREIRRVNSKGDFRASKILRGGNLTKTENVKETVREVKGDFFNDKLQIT